MNGINTYRGIEGAPLTGGARSPAGSQPERLPVATNTTDSRSNVHLDPVRTTVTFSTYGPDNEQHIVMVVENRETGAIIREIPSKATQKISIHIETLI